MKVRLKRRLLVVTAETDDERRVIGEWGAQADGEVFALFRQDERTVRLTGLGPRAEACREPIQITSRAKDPAIQLVSNFAHTPFLLDGRQYASVEGFWQGLKFEDPARRVAIAALHGHEARQVRVEAPRIGTVVYGGRTIAAGTADHWDLMLMACRAKFEQHDGARRALLGTGERPLVHRTRRDSRTIPGTIMADIWMRVRNELRAAAADPRERS